MANDSLLYLVRDLLVGNPIRRQQDAVDAAAKLIARERANVEYHRSLARFYGDRIATLNPHKGDHLAFAEAMEELIDHRRMQARYEAILEEADCVLRAETQRLYSMQHPEPRPEAE